MADIAAEAKMSVGVIYRYFANKEAIVEAIVASDLAEMRAKFAEWDGMPDDQILDAIIETLEMALTHRYDTEKTGVALEVLAEAARNPRVAAIVGKADVQERALGLSLCQRISPHSDPRKLAARSEIIGMLFDGMMIRAVSNPNVDRNALLDGLRQVMRVLFTLPDEPDAVV
jgi:TetR/AcrR family transcriptional regulator, repressor for uid operon